jgi:hypothetical protein
MSFTIEGFICVGKAVSMNKDIDDGHVTPYFPEKGAYHCVSFLGEVDAKFTTPVKYEFEVPPAFFVEKIQVSYPDGITCIRIDLYCKETDIEGHRVNINIISHDMVTRVVPELLCCE